MVQRLLEQRARHRRAVLRIDQVTALHLLRIAGEGAIRIDIGDQPLADPHRLKVHAEDGGPSDPLRTPAVPTRDLVQDGGDFGMIVMLGPEEAFGRAHLRGSALSGVKDVISGLTKKILTRQIRLACKGAVPVLIMTSNAIEVR